MPKIPIYQTQVGEAQPNRLEPQLSPLSSVNTASQDLQKAIQERIGTVTKVTQALTARWLENERLKSDTEASDLYTKFVEKDNELLNSNEEDVLIFAAKEGEEQEEIRAPKGIYNRKLGQVKDASIRYKVDYNNLKEEFLEKATSDRSKALLQRSIDNRFNSTYSNVNRHEANQTQQHRNNILDRKINNHIVDAAGIRRSKDLTESIDDAIHFVDTKAVNNGFDKDTRNRMVQETAREITKGAIFGMVQYDYKAAQKLLDSQKKRTFKQDYADTNRKLATNFPYLNLDKEGEAVPDRKIAGFFDDNVQEGKGKGEKIPLLSKDDVLQLQNIIDGKKIAQRNQNYYLAIKSKDYFVRPQGASLSGTEFEEYEIEIPETPDWERIRDAIDNDKSLKPDEKPQVYSYVKSKIMDDMRIKESQDHAQDLEFENTALEWKKKNVPVEKAMTLATEFGRNNKDRAFKEKFIKKLYEAPKETNRRVYVNLWEKIQGGGSSREQIDLAFVKGYLNPTDWSLLRKNYYNIQRDGFNAEKKDIYERIKIEAKNGRKVSDKNLASYMYSISKSTKDMPPEETYSFAKERLKADKESGFFFHDALWETDLERRDKFNQKWGEYYLKVGREEVDFIGKSISANGEDYSIDQIEVFANEFGGIDNIQEGSPVHNAIKSLKRYGRPAKPKFIKEVLRNQPDGIVP